MATPRPATYGAPRLQKLLASRGSRRSKAGPAPLSKYLGCNHTFTKERVGKDVVTKSQLDMSDYPRQACDLYLE